MSTATAAYQGTVRCQVGAYTLLWVIHDRGSGGPIGVRADDRQEGGKNGRVASRAHRVQGYHSRTPICEPGAALQ